MKNRDHYKVIWTETAKKDLIQIIQYIALDSPASAKKAANKIKQKTQKLGSFPSRGRWVRELQDVGIYIYRELIEKPWRIVYRVEKNTVYVTGG